jgi:hypothetical protein
MKLICSFLSQRKSSVSAKAEMSTPREIQAGVPHGAVLSPTLFSMHINDTPAPGVHLTLFVDDICLYATDRKEGFVLRKFQHGLGWMQTWYERWNIKSNEDTNQGIYFFRSRQRPVPHLTLHGRSIPFVNNVKYLGVIFDKRVAWRRPSEHLLKYSLFSSEWSGANIKLTLHKTLIRSVMTCASHAWEIAADTHLMKLQHLQSKVLRRPRHS